MGIWMEVRCEDRSEEWSEGHGYFPHRCWSHENEGPMGEAPETREGVINTYRHLEEEARSLGWVRFRHGWVCPYCKNLRPKV
ncbi:hypothetical protein VL2_gp033 [Pseudomonas phage vB_PaeM_VL12]|uniref:Uncharacterized protein n=10 Tax=Nankokuvirus TaxID=1925779 RepID=A0A0K0L9A4_9CAUD|nr:hypothetical protein KPP10_gp121 [Pseudomonas phage KPP10]YP_008857003.1 hypothetical protein X832_gp127 [Pseudomonas phage PAK_P5]YP_008858150.1 hypothetical protein X837_gp127 [Pseudomonas phage CHA_P1]YP_009205979.1 hypothetical protein AVT15_gp014 [Pseudomonas phage vB_PaeM_PS24]QEM41052.1 hypothetical protein PAPJP_127 [Pseudomonas phage PAP-JP]QIQ63927.1 hypothetical protein Epa24_00008 [Pseudomonas phage Epa24]QIQ64181.1 hypothetical protein Epa17_00149 [Pseudomonas phage Epa17]QIQ